ncbi:MAG: hypothetical protein MR531_01065 [Lachnospiraceae bacterium]|nr:hypothetical protein [Lachnospiraceae bacterium]
MDIWRNTRRSIKEYAIEVVIIISFFSVKEDIMYQIIHTDWVDEFNVINSTVDECWKDVLGGEEDEGDIEIIQIKKTYIDSNQHIDVFFDSKRNVLEDLRYYE